MPQKSKRELSLLDVAAPRRGRGRPRKNVLPEALLPFRKHEIATVEQFKSLERDLKPTADNSTSRRMNPATSERNYTSEEVEFMNALAEFKRASGRTFPTCSEILGVLRSLGYEKVNEVSAEKAV